MILLQTHQLSKSYGGQTVLSNINIELKDRDRIGLVGANGAGKTTLLHLLIGELDADDGEIFRSKSTQIGYLAQDSGLDTHISIWEEMKKIFAHLQDKEKDLRVMEAQMSDDQWLEDEKKYEQLLSEYAQASESFKDEGGYAYEARIRTILSGLRFADKDYDTPVHTLSGGQKTRLALGKLLLQQPDILILDEPTNHLDLDTLSWLENYLVSYEGAILIVSHDRYFLDKICTLIYEIERSQATRYTGNYSDFVRKKAEDYEQQLKQFIKQDKEIKEMEEFVQRNIARDSTSNRAKSRRKALEKMDKMDQPQGSLKKAQFTFEVQRNSGQDVLKVDDLSVGYAGLPVSHHLSFRVARANRIGIVGPNGVGKTTLLKTLIQQLPPLSGSIQWGSHVALSYYDQEHDKLHPKHTVLAELWDEYPHLLEKEVRGLLGQFLFSGDDVFKRIAELSGGERARVALAKLMLEKANVLILDEPTNHLDVYSKETLESALEDYTGTLLFVSHDRYFLNQLCTHIFEISAQGVHVYLGNYDYYMEKKQELQEMEDLKKEKDWLEQVPSTDQAIDYEQTKADQRSVRKKEREKASLEREIEQLEEQLTQLEAELTEPQIYTDYEKANDVQKAIETIKEDLDERLERWSALED